MKIMGFVSTVNFRKCMRHQVSIPGPMAHSSKNSARQPRFPCEELYPGRFFQDGMCDGAFLTREYTYDAIILRDYFMEKLQQAGSMAAVQYGIRIEKIEKTQDSYVLNVKQGRNTVQIQHRFCSMQPMRQQTRFWICLAMRNLASNMNCVRLFCAKSMRI